MIVANRHLQATLDPVASVVIPTRNRREMLSQVIASALAQSVHVEVIVMDDGSTDGTADWVRERFPSVQLQRSEVSQGPAYQRNAGARLVTTQFLFTIDDDCVLGSSETIATTIEAFDRPQIGAVTIPFINVRSDNLLRSAAPVGDTPYATFEYYGGMIAFRRDAFLQVGGYRPSYFMHVEESDLSVRLLAAGHVVRLGHAMPIHHLESPQRDLTRLHRLGARNHVLFCWYNVPWPYFPVHLAGSMARTFWHGCRIGQIRLVSLGLLQGCIDSLREWKARQPIASSTYRLGRKLKKTGPLLLDQVMP